MRDPSGWQCCRWHPIDLIYCPHCHHPAPETTILEYAHERVNLAEQRRARRTK